MNNRMHTLFTITGILTIGMIFWAALGYLMDLSSFAIVLPLCGASILVFLGTGFLKNYFERRKFREFIESQKQDLEIQEKIKNEHIDKGDKTGRAKVKIYFKERNAGLNWTGASVHGAVPQRKRRRTFLPKNR
jgi:low affinity Fe/Cu permease